MTPVRSRTGREEVSEYLNDAYRASSNQYKAPASTRMWNQGPQREKLKSLSSDARLPVLQFLRERPGLRKTLEGDSPHLQEYFQLAVDAIGQANETQKWEALADVLMDACVANPAASIDLHEVLFGVVTPAGPWNFWGQGALKKLVAPISTIAGFGLQAFRNNQPRDAKNASSRSFHSAHSEPDDFSIGTARSDSDDPLPQMATSAASDHPLSLNAPTHNTSDNSARVEPVSKQQTLASGDQAPASSMPQPAAAISTASVQAAASSSTTESAGPSALTLKSGSPNTVVQAAAGGSGNKKPPSLKPAARVESTESANLQGTQASTAGESNMADVGAPNSSTASRPKPDIKSEQEPLVGASVSRDGSKRVPAKSLRSKRSADAMEGEVGFPMPSRSKQAVAVAMPGPERPQRLTSRIDELDAKRGPLPDPSKMSEQELADYSAGLEKRIHEDLDEDDLPSQFKLFEDDGTMVEGGTELLAAWEAKYTRDVERANAAYEAAQRQYLLLTNKDAKSAIPSRVDQLRSRTPGSLATPPTGQPSSLAASEARLAHGKTFAEIMAEANSVLEDSKRQNAMLAGLKPFRELEKVRDERQKQQMDGFPELQGLPAGALQSTEATKAAIEKMQTDRLAAMSSATGPRARAQEQLSALEASLSRVSPSMYDNEAYKKALRACQEAYSVGLGSTLPQQSGLAGTSASARAHESNPYWTEPAIGHDPALCARQAELVRATLDDWKAGKVPSLADALREQLSFGPEFAHIGRPRELGAAASTSFTRQQPSTPAQCQAMGTEVRHQDPPDELGSLYDDPPLGHVEPLRGVQRPTMLPVKARVNSRPGRGAMPLPISVHPQARPFGVTKSSLAIREAAQLKAKDPAKQLRTYRLPPNRTERPSKLENPLEGLVMPDQLSSPDIPESLLARYASTSASGAAVPGMDAAKAGTSADHVSGPALFNPRAKAKATPQVNAATTVDTAPKAVAALPRAPAPRHPLEQKPADVAQPVTSTAQAAPGHASPPVAAPAATLPADLTTAGAPAVAAPEAAPQCPSVPAELPATNTETEDAAAPADSAEDEAQRNKAIKQRPGQKQRKKLREMAELARAEDDAKAVAEAEAQAVAKAEAKAKANDKAAAEAAKAQAAAAVQAEAQRKEEARVKEAEEKAKAAAEEKAKAAAARLKAEAASEKAAQELLATLDAEAELRAQAAARKKQNKAGKKKAKGAALQLPAIAEDQPGPSNAPVAAAAPDAAPAVQDPAPVEAATGKAKAKKKKTQQAVPNLEQQSSLGNVSQVAASDAAGAAAPPISQAGPSQAVPVDPPAFASSSQQLPAALGKRIKKQSTVTEAGFGETSLDSTLVNPQPEGPAPTASTAPPAEASTANGQHIVQSQLSPIVGVVSRQYLPPVETRDDSAGGWTVVNGHQRHAEPAAAPSAPADPVPNLFQADPALASVRWGEQPMDDPEPTEDREAELEVEKIGLAALEGQFPLRRRGVRAGRRHKKRYGLRDPSMRPPTASENSEDDSDHTVRERIAVGQLPTSPLARHPSPWGYPDAPGSPVPSIGLPPGLPVGNAAWPEVASIAAEQNARQTRRANALQAAQAAEAAKSEAAQRAHAAAETRKQADVMTGQEPAGEMWPALHASGPSSAGGVLPRDAAAAMAEQIVADNQPRDAGAVLMAKPKPKARNRAAVRAPTAAEAAAAAAAAATVGLWKTSIAPAKGPKKLQGTIGVAEGASTSRQADADAALQPDVQSPQLKEPMADLDSEGHTTHAELVEFLEAELEADFCCPLTLDEFEDPVRAADGRAYERAAIEQWLATHDTSPMTNEPMPHRRLVPDPELKHRMLELIAKLTALTGE